MWYTWVKKFVYENGGKSFITDLALFIWHHKNKLIGIMIVHVDAFLCAGTELFYQNVIYKSLYKKHFQLAEKKIVILNILI